MSEKSDPTVSFTLQEANELLPTVIRLTDSAKVKLSACRHPWHSLGLRKYNVLADMPEEDCVRVRWATQIAQLGAYPKGLFTVDFQNADGETVYCWGDGETEITHQHKVWENFSHRKPIEDQ